ncbi:MAG: DEAD/DEAH box helicase [Rhodospirillaceae bacterium]|nr:DEAD/DEAH box helicase [Rhodospirillaceae bacterium]
MPFPSSHPALERALVARAYLEPTPVQAAVLAAEAAERDLLVSAQTGSGKTVAFGLAMARTLLGDAPQFARTRQPLALIVAPTRELAMQVHSELSWLYADAGARVVACVGGMDARREQRQLADGCHIVVGTPGRLRDHLERGHLDASALRAVVLDEADEMLDLGFREDLEFILDATPSERRTLLFSATIAREIANLARTYQRDALRIDTQLRNQAHGDIEYHAIRLAPTDVDHAIVNVLRYHEAKAALVFCHTREAVRHLHASLVERGFAAVALSGELSQSERTHALQALRDGRARVCVATDVAARGLDLPDLNLVIHAELPRDKATLLHRSGRTGRAGRKGICVLMVPFTRRRRLEELLANASIKALWQDPPKPEDIRARDQQRLLSDPLLTEANAPEDLVLARALLAERSAEDVAAAFIRFHRARLPAPEDLFNSGPGMDTRRPDMPRERRDSFREREDGPRTDKYKGERNRGDMVWFELGVGRAANADPKWLIPLICRRGHITKNEIGFIKIEPETTRFEIVADAAERFEAALGKAGPQDIAIQRAGGAAPVARTEQTPRSAPYPKTESAARVREARGEGDRAKPYGKKPYGDKSRAEKPRGDKPWVDRPRGDKPWAGKPRGEKPSGDKPWPLKSIRDLARGDTAATDPAPAARFQKDGPARERPFGVKPKKKDRVNKDKGKRRKPSGS